MPVWKTLVSEPVGQVMAATCHLLLISGSLRTRSTNTAVLRTAQALAPDSVTILVYDRVAELPHFNPDYDTDQPPPAVGDLRTAIRQADAVLFSVPEYAGALPGSFKNLLDWTIGDDQPGSIYEKPVAWINASPRGAVNAHESLRKVLGYASAAILEPACVEIPVIAAMLDDDGLIVDASTRGQVTHAVTTLAGHACASQGGETPES